MSITTKRSEVSVERRRVIIELFLKGISQSQIAKDLSHRRTTVQSIIYRFLGNGRIENKDGRGRKPSWTIRDTNSLLRIVKTHRKETLKKVVRLFNEEKDHPFSEKTVRRKLKECGFVRRSLKKVKTVRGVNRKKRIQFCLERRHWSLGDWKKVVFSDETMVAIGKEQKVFIWRKRDEKYAPHLVCSNEQKRFSVMFWGCMTYDVVGYLSVGRLMDQSTSPSWRTIFALPSCGTLGMLIASFSRIMLPAIRHALFRGTSRKRNCSSYPGPHRAPM